LVKPIARLVLIAVLCALISCSSDGQEAAEPSPPPDVVVTFAPPHMAETQTPVAQVAATPSPVADAIPAQPPVRRVSVSAEEVVRGPAGRPYLSLVVNAGAGYEVATEILDVLAEKGVRTTFFLLGWWAERNPDVVHRIDAEGHEIASHGHSVFDLTSVSDAAVVADLERADEVISGITGKTTRPLWSPSAGYRDARVRGIAARLGYRPIFWSQDSGDWTLDATPQGVYARAVAGIEPGAIIVLHMDSARSRTATASILGRLIDTVRERGLEPVTITELVGEEE
jgi:peptidoglycan/xylan/chitin deacetylase (PgdA/CDA1 family)